VVLNEFKTGSLAVHVASDRSLQIAVHVASDLNKTISFVASVDSPVTAYLNFRCFTETFS